MTTAIDGFTPTTSTDGSSSSSSSSSSGVNNLSSSDFIKLMITQLEQQDPTNPTDSNQILTQLSQISTLQSNTQMQSSLQSLTLQQSIGAAGNLIGKTITGKDANANSVTGVVTGVTVTNQQVSLTVNSTATDGSGTVTSTSIPMGNVLTIAPTTGTSDTDTLKSLFSQYFGSFLPGASTSATGNTSTPTNSAPLVAGSGSNTISNPIQSAINGIAALTGGST